MKINGIYIEFNPDENSENFKNFDNAYSTIAKKSKKNEEKLSNKEISKQKFEKKQVKLIKNFFESITDCETSEKLFETCCNINDYINIFRKCTRMVSCTRILYNQMLSIKRKQK
jgi:hypothetical protein